MTARSTDIARYHSRRAREERLRAGAAQDSAAGKRHLDLAKLHEARGEALALFGPDAL